MLSSCFPAQQPFPRSSPCPGVQTPQASLSTLGRLRGKEEEQRLTLEPSLHHFTLFRSVERGDPSRSHSISRVRRRRAFSKQILLRASEAYFTPPRSLAFSTSRSRKPTRERRGVSLTSLTRQRSFVDGLPPGENDGREFLHVLCPSTGIGGGTSSAWKAESE
ncbi:hypothetical protein TGCAST_387760 [Toxoplasma gondii CAST]|uniref:Uncharacterized protein n=1 Tax=Toxoplasma gondii CAST TaxID=943122 RepID=A0A425I2T5_TOXGO|nr:hypothetical protein TGCAST_387760 [Toxoplasma gondii CAST]